jgi:glutathione synthase/RimK-type ligase-like ATP-grasp enzyme
VILILSDDQLDDSSDPVVDWLLALNAKFLKLNITDLVNQRKISYEIGVSNRKFYFDSIDLTDKINVIWARRFSFGSFTKKFSDRQLISDISGELSTLINYIFSVLQDKKWIPDPSQIHINKLHALNIASKYGLNVPSSKVINNKKALVNYLSENNNGIICKPMNYCGYYYQDDVVSTAFTTLLDSEAVTKIPDYFFPTLFQFKIAPQQEIRSFFLAGKLYSTAILNGKRNHVDVKLDYKSASTHFVPYNLPEEISDKIMAIMDCLKLNTGSIDLIKDEKGDYFFIEVNPVGQFMAHSNRCNFYLDKLFAEYLIATDEENTIK